MRIIRNKSTGEKRKQYAHLSRGEYVYLRINNCWEVVEEPKKERLICPF